MEKPLENLSGKLLPDHFFTWLRWNGAAQRLLQHDSDRRRLVVVSDGCPMDSATAQVNDQFYLDNHLQQVVQKYDRPGQLEIYGLGVGLDLSPYYRRHLALDLTRGADNHLLREIVGLWMR